LAIFGATILWIIYSAASGRDLKQRLTDPAPFEEEVAAEPANA
jgi:hypothetical protein